MQPIDISKDTNSDEESDEDVDNYEPQLSKSDGGWMKPMYANNGCLQTFGLSVLQHVLYDPGTLGLANTDYAANRVIYKSHAASGSKFWETKVLHRDDDQNPAKIDLLPDAGVSEEVFSAIEDEWKKHAEQPEDKAEGLPTANLHASTLSFRVVGEYLQFMALQADVDAAQGLVLSTHDPVDRSNVVVLASVQRARAASETPDSLHCECSPPQPSDLPWKPPLPKNTTERSPNCVSGAWCGLEAWFVDGQDGFSGGPIVFKETEEIYAKHLSNEFICALRITAVFLTKPSADTESCHFHAWPSSFTDVNDLARTVRTPAPPHTPTHTHTHTHTQAATTNNNSPPDAQVAVLDKVLELQMYIIADLVNPTQSEGEGGSTSSFPTANTQQNKK